MTSTARHLTVAAQLPEPLPIEERPYTGGDAPDDEEFAPRVSALYPESCILAALPHLPRDLALVIVDDVLTAEDFENPSNAALFAIERRLIRADHGHDFALIHAEISRRPESIHHHRTILRRMVNNLITVPAYPERAREYAHAVIAEAYRRSFHTAATQLAHIAEHAGTDDLYEQMCILGRRQRDLHDRYTRLTTTATSAR